MACTRFRVRESSDQGSMPEALTRGFFMRAVLIVLAAAVTLAGCSDRPGAAAPAADATATSQPPDGTPQMATAADGVHIEYRAYGHGNPVVVLVHGWSCSSSYWKAQVDALKAQYTVVTVDLAGHGASGGNRTQWSIAAFGADVAAVANKFPNRPVIVVGHAMGGSVALEAARILGGRILGVIGVDAFKSLGLPRQTPDQIAAELAPFRADFVGATRKLVSASFFTKDADAAFVRKIADDMSSAPPEIAIPALGALREWDPAPALASIRAPIIAINADAGQATDEARILKVAPTFRAVTIPGTGHFLMMETPQRFNPVLEQDILDLIKARVAT
jgi:pimeloyl-ACP methyl ester carboxylesterase